MLTRDEEIDAFAKRLSDKLFAALVFDIGIPEGVDNAQAVLIKEFKRFFTELADENALMDLFFKMNLRYVHQTANAEMLVLNAPQANAVLDRMKKDNDGSIEYALYNVCKDRCNNTDARYMTDAERRKYNSGDFIIEEEDES